MSKLEVYPILNIVLDSGRIVMIFFMRPLEFHLHANEMLKISQHPSIHVILANFEFSSADSNLVSACQFRYTCLQLTSLFYMHYRIPFYILLSTAENL